MLMALLPLAAWANDPTPKAVTIQCANIEFTYGDNDIPNNNTMATADMIGVVSNPQDATLDQIRAALKFQRIGNTSKDANELGYTYRLVQNPDYVANEVVVTITGGNGTLYINKRNASISVGDKTIDYNTALDLSAVTKTLTGFLTGEAPTVTLSNTATSTNAGTYADALVAEIDPAWTKAGNYNVTNTSGTLTIDPLPVNNSKFSAALASQDAIVYDGEAQKPNLTVTYDGVTLTKDDGYTVIWENNTNAALKTAASAPTATVKLTNYYTSTKATLATKTVKFTIEQKSINDETVSAFVKPSYRNHQYTGEAISIANGWITVKDGDASLIRNTDFERTAIVNNTNVPLSTATDDEKPYVEIQGIGNYKDTRRLYFNITKAPLTIAAVNANKDFGTADPVFTATYTGLKDVDMATPGSNTPAEGVLSAVVTLTRAQDDTDNPGEHDIIVGPADLTAQNYEITKTNGVLTIGPATITVTPVAGQTKVYGESDPDEFTYNVTPANLASKITSLTLKRANADNENVGTYELSLDECEVVPGYDVVVTAGVNFEITAAPLKITADNFVIAKDGDMPEFTCTITGLTNGDDVDDVYTGTPSLNCATDVSTTAGEFAITPSAGSFVLSSTNYAVQYVAGVLTITGNGMDLTLGFDADAADKIASADGNEHVNVKLGNQPLAAKRWHAFVLPFETSAAELVAMLGKYVVVNTLKSSSITNGVESVKFGLVMDEIPAGTPFLIKPAEGTNWNTNKFENKTIEETITGTTAAGSGAQFLGTYDADKSIRWGYNWETGLADPGYVYVEGNPSANLNNEYAKSKFRWMDPTRGTVEEGGAWATPVSSAKSLSPMQAFLKLSETATGARIFVEDFENGTTSIKSLDADEIDGLKVAEGWYTINGIKLQSMPTEKGIYINNGKKVVIK